MKMFDLLLAKKLGGGGAAPTGTKYISITQNGITTEDVTDYAGVEITVNTLPEKGLVFEDYDSDGYPHSARFVGTWTEIPASFFESICGNSATVLNIISRISSVIIPNSVTAIRHNAFNNTRFVQINMPDNDITIDQWGFHGCVLLEEIEFKKDVTFTNSNIFSNCMKLASVTFGGNVNTITNSCFQQSNTSNVTKYDFSHCTAIPPLYSVVSLGHATGCVIRIPAALSDTTLGEGNGWESATNWSALTDIVWEVV